MTVLSNYRYRRASDDIFRDPNIIDLFNNANSYIAEIYEQYFTSSIAMIEYGYYREDFDHHKYKRKHKIRLQDSHGCKISAHDREFDKCVLAIHYKRSKNIFDAELNLPLSGVLQRFALSFEKTKAPPHLEDICANLVSLDDCVIGKSDSPSFITNELSYVLKSANAADSKSLLQPMPDTLRKKARVLLETLESMIPDLERYADIETKYEAKRILTEDLKEPLSIYASIDKDRRDGFDEKFASLFLSLESKINAFKDYVNKRKGEELGKKINYLQSKYDDFSAVP